MSEPKERAGQDWGTVRGRVAWLLADRFGGNRTAMAAALGLTHMPVSHAVAGTRPPGSRLLRAIIERLGVNADWLLRGRGPPFADEGGRVRPRRAPVLDQPLPGRRRDRTGQELDRWEDATRLLSATQYWLRLGGGHALLAGRRPGFLLGDLLLFETDPTRFPPEDGLYGQLCAVRDPRRPDAPVALGVVTYRRAAEEDGGDRLEVEVVERPEGTAEVADEYVFRVYPGGDVRPFQRKVWVDRGDRGGGKPRRNVPASQRHEEHAWPKRIEYGAVVAVWTGLLLRLDQARP
jgi:hypothetical protein